MHRIAFELPIPFTDHRLPIHWYGLMIAIGFMLGYGAMLWRARKLNFPAERIADIVFTAVLSGLAGARVLYVINYWQRDFQGRPFREIFAVHKGGLVFFGGFIGGAIALIILARVKKLDLATVCDLSALGVPLAHTFGRMGCFLNGCCFGKYTAGAMGFRYPLPEYIDVLHQQHAFGLLTPDRLHYLEMTGEPPFGSLSPGAEQFQAFVQGALPHYCLPVIPVQLLNSLRNIITFIVLLWLCRKLKHPGQLAAVFLVLYGVGRFVTEFWRGDYPSLTLGLTSAQWICIVVVPVGIALFRWLATRRTAAPETA